MPNVLFCWLGQTDLNAAAGDPKAGDGPILNVLAKRPFDETVLLSNYDADSKVDGYLKWLRTKTSAKTVVVHVRLSDPTDHLEIYQAAADAVEKARKRHGKDLQLTFHLSPGTPAMASVWLLLSKSRFPAELVQSSRERGVRSVTLPFEIAVDWPDDALMRLGEALPPQVAGFSDILHESAVMRRVVSQAARVAVRSVPVLLEGESGTGKELFARAIHDSSPRKDKPLVTVNCGAIPENLIESELFGHVKGAFTGATDRRGHFETAAGGTIFLDEIGELPLAAQPRLLRVLQERKVTRVGSSKEIAVDVRVIAATNRDLVEQVANGSFRADLLYRLNVITIKLPPLRERGRDLNLLITWLFDSRRGEMIAAGESVVPKQLGAGALNVLVKHSWPGNVRELINTLTRLLVLGDNETVTPEDVRAALTTAPERRSDAILGRPLGGGFDIRDLLGDVARHYLERAMQEADGNKSLAAELVGLPSYQTLTGWLEKHGVSAPRTRRRRR